MGKSDGAKLKQERAKGERVMARDQKRKGREGANLKLV